MPSQLPSLPLSLIKDTRIRTSRHDYDHEDDRPQHSSWFGGGGGGGRRGPILPVYKPSRRTRKRSERPEGGSNRFWSPYFAPRRRSKRLVLLWLGAFFFVGLVTWWRMSTWRGANGGGGGLPSDMAEVKDG